MIGIRRMLLGPRSPEDHIIVLAVGSKDIDAYPGRIKIPGEMVFDYPARFATVLPAT